jgi:hypothetical protein
VVSLEHPIAQVTVVATIIHPLERLIGEVPLGDEDLVLQLMKCNGRSRPGKLDGSGTLLALCLVMLFGRGTLSISRLAEQDGVVLASASAALRLRAEGGYTEAGRTEAIRLFDQAVSRNRPDVRKFAAEARLTSADLSRTSDPRLLALVRDCIRDGRVVALRKAASEPNGAESALVVRRRLLRDIEARTRGRLEQGGRRYKLVADVELAKLPDRDRHEVVDREGARQILEAVASLSGDPELAVLLGQARDQLTADWRPPFGRPDGLILLRRVRGIELAAMRREPAITPSQWKALSEAGWIEIEFVDTSGKPVGVGCRLELPDCTLVEARDEVVARRGFVPGICRLCLPKVDAAVWSLERFEGKEKAA